ncbi:MAG: transcription antitermination factor NusB [Candidatus Komeilibacteria bacterium]
MSNRHLARTLALQTLFQWDFNGQKENLENILKYNFQEFALDFNDDGFSYELVMGIKKNSKAIDSLITKFAPEWPLDQITISDRNCLRIGIYELKFDPQIPPKVAINEAIELAKTYGGESSGKFINGVLGSIYKEMEAAGEKQNMEKKEVSAESAGGIVYYQDKQNKHHFAIIRNRYGKWSLPKGTIEAGEKPSDTALREVKEETGLINLTLGDKVGQIKYDSKQPPATTVHKTVTFYLMASADMNSHTPDNKEIQAVEWLPADEAIKRLDYDNAKKILAQGIKQLNN